MTAARLVSAFIFFMISTAHAQEWAKEKLENFIAPWRMGAGDLRRPHNQTEELMKSAGKKFEFRMYDGAGHGFMRAGEAPDASQENRAARAEAWEWWRELLRQL